MITTAALPPTRQETVRELLATVTEHDGISPLDEAAVLALDGESAQHLLVEEAGALRGYASVLPDGTVQGMIDPAHRRRGHGTALLQEALALRADAGVWAHGALEGSLTFLAGAGLAESRYLLTLHRDLDPARPLPAVPTSTLAGLRLSTFEAERDAERWVTVNARAFVDHPEQGAMTREDLEQRLAQPWFDAEDMLVALRDDELVGFVWVKRERPGATDQDAEIYVVATDPSVQGHRVAGLLMATSLDRLRADGVPGVELYVEADNAPALRLYETWGFTITGRDVQMRATGRS
ncbi:MAG: mycothiol synthase [Brachybacterium sp.]|uniref:mycothiol synthase n=1 Tax=Brachybacterium sp. TaxID=1891286 RepID=UPI00264D342E|nr:mycothiol synthase [Brachybacterium sp.]